MDLSILRADSRGKRKKPAPAETITPIAISIIKLRRRCDPGVVGVGVARIPCGVTSYARKNQRDRKTDQQEYDDQTERPVWKFPRGENRGADLNYESRGDDVSGGNPVHFSSLQLLEEAAHNIYRPMMTIA